MEFKEMVMKMMVERDDPGLALELDEAAISARGRLVHDAVAEIDRAVTAAGLTPAELAAGPSKRLYTGNSLQNVLDACVNIHELGWTRHDAKTDDLGGAFIVMPLDNKDVDGDPGHLTPPRLALDPAGRPEGAGAFTASPAQGCARP
eukprot:tig00000145_g8822.t1